MANFHNIYDLQPADTERGLRYFFISEGEEKDVVKAIQYSYIQQLSDREVYNLGFGDYDIETDKLNDIVNSNNGDHYRVFNTVLSTIPTFFGEFKRAVLMVHASDARPGFVEHCKPTCSKKCTTECKNFKRRINLYQRYVNKNYQTLSADYHFLGGTLNHLGATILEDYITGKDYDSVLLFERNV